MLYTLCSHGRRLATTDLGFIYRPGGFRCGWLHATSLGERLLPIAAGVAPALRAQYLLGPDPTLRADLIAASAYAEGLDLELRREDGVLIETADIAVIDTEYLLSIADAADHENEYEDGELSPEQKAEIEEFVAEIKEDLQWTTAADPEEPAQFPRFQIQVQLIDPADVP